MGRPDFPLSEPAQLEHAIGAFAAEPNGGLLVLSQVAIHRDLILSLAARHRLPMISAYKSYPAGGGLMSYGSDVADLFRGAASYVDRILRGAKVSELPVQFPTKFELIVNVRAAKTLGRTIPEAFLLRADELIE
jgi:putative ABC transport system substrate-binding protein